jgi:hypothetical protein
MQWSKLKSRIKGLICPELRDRIDFHLTSYRESHDEADKVWITVDGQRVFSCKHYPYERARADSFRAGLRGEQVNLSLAERELHSPKDFGDAMRAYLDLPVKEALTSSNQLIKAFALVDRRTGKRAFGKIELPDSEHSLVKVFFNLRRASLHD